MSEVKLPSGLSGTIRKLSVKEGKLFSDRAKSRDGTLFTSILKACWTSTSDPGPYAVNDGANPDWTKVLAGDRLYAVIRVRCASFGSEYTFRVQCSNEACRHPYDWSLNLDELEIKHLSDEAKSTFLAGNKFEVALPEDGRRVTFRLTTGADEELAAKVFRGAKEDLLFKALNFRILEIEDVEEKAKRRFIEDMSLSDATSLLQMMDEMDCGVETEIQVECPECYGVDDIRLPLGTTFYFPKMKKATSSLGAFSL